MLPLTRLAIKVLTKLDEYVCWDSDYYITKLTTIEILFYVCVGSIVCLCMIK